MKRKINIGFISPYPAMEPVIKELENLSSDLSVKVKTGNLEAGVAFAKAMEKEGADIIISRGGTAKMIRDAVTIPVVDIHISGYDLLRSIMLASSHSEDTIALVGFPTITMGASSIVSLLDIPVKVVTIQAAEEVEKILLELQQRGFTRILGDVVTVEVSSRLGMHGMLIHSGRESISEAFEEVRRLYQSLAKSQKLFRIAQTLLAERESDFLVADEAGKVLYEHLTTINRGDLAFQELKNLGLQAIKSGLPALKIAKTENGTYSIRAEALPDRDGALVAFFFEPINKMLKKMQNIEIEQISQMPPLIAESAEMKKVKQTVESSKCIHGHIHLIGEAGTGKKSVAHYLHAFHQKNGFFVAAGIEDAKKFMQELFTLHVSTLYLKLGPSIDEATIFWLEKLSEKAAEGRTQVIFSSEKPLDGFSGSKILGEATTIPIPGLENRSADIEAISRQFLAEFHQTLGTQPVKIHSDAMADIVQSPAGRDLASLKSYIRQLALLEKGYVIEKTTLQQIPVNLEATVQEAVLSYSRDNTLKEIEQKLIEQILQEEEFNQTKAAKRLGINRATLWRKLKK